MSRQLYVCVDADAYRTFALCELLSAFEQGCRGPLPVVIVSHQRHMVDEIAQRLGETIVGGEGSCVCVHSDMREEDVQSVEMQHQGAFECSIGGIHALCATEAGLERVEGSLGSRVVVNLDVPDGKGAAEKRIAKSCAQEAVVITMTSPADAPAMESLQESWGVRIDPLPMELISDFDSLLREAQYITSLFYHLL